MPDVSDRSNGFKYYVYTSAATGYDPMKAHGVMRATVENGFISAVESLVDGAWVHEPKGKEDIEGISGATGVTRVTEAELRKIIAANSKTLDPDAILASS